LHSSGNRCGSRYAGCNFIVFTQSYFITDIDIIREEPERQRIGDMKGGDEIGLSKYDKITASDFIFSVDYPKNADVTYLEVKVSTAVS